jgi:hypothetical protein
MLKKNISLLLIILLTTGLSLSAKEKNLSLKKFKCTDIGNPDVSGSSLIQDNSITITAGGADVWGVEDEFRFVYMEQTGDFDLVAQIESLSDPHLYTKAGLMAREELSDNSRHIFFRYFRITTHGIKTMAVMSFNTGKKKLAK